MNPDLGPQCHTCRKRRVKCDSNKPFCRRCSRENLECGGFEKVLKIVAYKPPKHKSLSAKAQGKDKRRQTSSKPRATTESGTLLSLSKPSTELDYLALLESFQYYDCHVLPRTIPAQHPFRRNSIDRNVPWHILPKIVQHFMIVSLRSMRTSLNTPELGTRRDICYYRGLGLSELQTLLPGAVEDPHGIGLSCILMLMAADMLQSPIGQWTAHFTAAQRIIHLRGGFRQCLQSIPTSRSLLVNYMVVDILTGASSDVKSLEASAEDVSEYFCLIPDMERELPVNGCVCPSSVLQAISCINTLRGADATFSAGVFDTIWQTLQTFDPEIWALSLLQTSDQNILPVSSKQLPGPEETVALTVIGRCYQSAALLYLAKSCDDTTSSVSTTDLTAVKATLTTCISAIFQQASDDPDSPLHTQLWRFLSWPLFITAYISIAWPEICVDIMDTTADAELNRIKTTASALGSNRLHRAADFLHNIWNERSQKRKWKWEDGFFSRYAFCL